MKPKNVETKVFQMKKKTSIGIKINLKTHTKHKTIYETFKTLENTGNSLNLMTAYENDKN